jgi:cytochrome P450
MNPDASPDQQVPAPPATAAGCPFLPGFDPLAYEQAVDPEPWLARARAEAPVFYIPEIDHWAVTRRRDVDAVLRDTERFSSADVVHLPPLPAEAKALMPNGYPLETAPATIDPPRHTRLRKLAAKGFTPRAAKAHERATRELADRLIDGFLDDGAGDLATSYCQQIPIRVISMILGIEIADAQMLHRWVLDGVELHGGDPDAEPERVIELARTQGEFDRYVQDLIERRRGDPGEADDFVTSLLEAGAEDEAPLKEREIVGIVANAISAGADTAATTMAQCLHELLGDRDLWQRVVADPTLVEPAIEETLRIRPPFRALPRTATRDVELGGVTIPAGARVLAYVCTAHRDEEATDRAGEFDIDRPEIKSHLGFGRWAHFCLGAPLARMEMRIGIERLVDRLPSLRLAEEAELRYQPGLVVVPLVGGLAAEWDPTR